MFLRISRRRWKRRSRKLYNDIGRSGEFISPEVVNTPALLCVQRRAAVVCLRVIGV